jgi:hypothetical protein
MRLYFYFVVCGVIGLSTGACALPSPQENFTRVMNALIGVRLTGRQPGAAGDPTLAREVKILPNGTKEYKHLIHRECSVWIVANQDDVVTGWYTEGNRDRCGIAP